MAQEHDKDAAAPKGGTSPLDSNAKKPLNRGTTHTDPQDREEHDGAAPRQPHERDESADSQALANETAAQQGQRSFADAVGEQVDSDKGPLVNGGVQPEGGAASRAHLTGRRTPTRCGDDRAPS